MEFAETTKFWLKEAKEALKVARDLFDKKDYSYSLFFAHLAIEKILKSLYISINNEQAPYIHNLLRIAEACKIDMEEEQKLFLIRLTSYNLEARYPDEKRSFRKKCTKSYTAKELEKVKELFVWLKSKLK